MAALHEGWAWAPRRWTQVTDDTGVGDPAAATAAKGVRFFSAVTRQLAGFLIELEAADPEALYEWSEPGYAHARGGLRVRHSSPYSLRAKALGSRSDMSHRTFKDAAGQDWQVWDVLPERLVGHTLEAGWLTFQSADQKRRLTPVPLYWANAADDELQRLLADAKPVLEKPALRSTTENRPAPAS